MKRLYECIVVAAHAETDNLVIALKEGFNEENFSIAYVESWGKRTFAYKIKKYKRGFYLALYIYMTPEVVALFDRKLRINHDVIRHMILTIKEVPRVSPPIAGLAEPEKIEL